MWLYSVEYFKEDSSTFLLYDIYFLYEIMAIIYTLLFVKFIN